MAEKYAAYGRDSMSDLFSLSWWVIALVAIAGYLFTAKLTWSSRTGRRRRRNHYKIAARARKPMVTFMVSTR